MLKHRLLSGILIGAAICAALVYLPGAGLFALLLAISIATQWEFYRLVARGGNPACPVSGILFGVVWLSAVYALAPCTVPAFLATHRWEGLLLGLGFCALLVRLLFDPRARPIEQAATTLLGFLYVPFLLSFFLRLVQWGGRAPFEVTPQGLFLAFYLALVVKMADVGAYAAGVTLGRHRLFPRISPAKSWEGLYGGLIVAALFSVLAVTVVRRCEWIAGGPLEQWSVLHAVLAGLALAVVGTLGDLCESAFKRAVGVKDSSGSVPGMGGLLDVFDSLLFAPLALFLHLAWGQA